MEIIDVSLNDDHMELARKCRDNFRQIAWAIGQGNKLNRINSSDIAGMVNAISGQVIELTNDVSDLSNVRIPSEVASQIATQDIPGMVDNAVGAVLPPVGSYLMSDQMPSYAGTTWQQAGNIVTDTPATIPLWKRIS